MSSNKTISQRAKNLVEIIALWAIRAFLVRYSAVVATHFSQRDDNFAKLRSEVIFVAQDHHARLLKLEQSAQVAEVS
jgi:hypothetical protein